MNLLHTHSTLLFFRQRFSLGVGCGVAPGRAFPRPSLFRYYMGRSMMGGVDGEIVTLYHIFDESMSPYLPKNLTTYLPGISKPMTDDFMMSNKMHSINGYIMASHNAGLTMKKGQRVRWYVMGFGDVQGVHTAHWHGNVSIRSQRTTDVIEVLPAVAVVADMIPDDVGQWAYHCHVSNHAAAGMDTFYTVTP